MSDAWDRFAAREPYFAVITESRFLSSTFDAAAETDFFATGEAHVSSLYEFVVGTVGAHLTPLSVLEYGCGPGRLLLPFARRAEKVTGVDRSPAMLEAARLHAARAGVTNIELVDEETFRADRRTFDLVNCFLLFQRLRRREGLALFRSLALRVREGGVGVFHLPYRSRASRLTAGLRWTRSRLPVVNHLVNRALRKPHAMPLIEGNTYELNEVLTILQETGFDAPHLVYATHGDLDGVIVHAVRRHRPGVSRREEPAGTRVAPTAGRRPPDFIDVREMIAKASLDELNATAERYFSSLDTIEHHITKPFARVEDTPQLLISLGTLLQGLSLAPGMTVLEFGAGTGWLSRFLSQLGCRMIILDVSPSALAIARELYERQPLLGERPAPTFLTFDGRTIDLQDGSVDRIICFDSFHHAPNPQEVLAEFGRILTPRGIAGFAEPGPRHSLTPQSQFEMRTYGVIENDIDIDSIWQTARRFGFTDLRLAAYSVPPFHVSLANYKDLLAAGETYGRWAEWTRSFLQDVRMFFLNKAGSETSDSRRPDGLQCEIKAAEVKAKAGQPYAIEATVRNSGRSRWLASTEAIGGVSLGFRLYNADGGLADLEYARAPLPRALEPDEETVVTAELPPLERGSYILEIDCVANQVAWFAQLGTPAPRITLEVA
ncbi:MAG TPA: methyltransferase domain-containing protein [Thermoanaerobaculia bacterium]